MKSNQESEKQTDKLFAEVFARKSEVLNRLAQEALEEHKSGKTKDLEESV